MHIEETSYRDLAMAQLTPEQQDFIMNSMRRGKRSAWINVMAEMKGIVISEEDDEETIVRKIGGWILEGFDDLGARDGKCECGTPIRYVYHVAHIETQDSFRLGSTCIEHYTGLDAKTVDAVIKRMKVIDYEKEEILGKVIEGWTLPFDVPVGLAIPNDIQQHFDHGLPLLERQISRLKKLIVKYNHEHMQQTQDAAAPMLKKQKGKELPVYDLFSSFDEVAPVAELAPTPVEKYRGGGKEVPNLKVIPNEWKTVIQDKLQELSQNGQTHTTALQMAQYVAQVFGHDRDLYLTGKPRTYYWVASYMDTLPNLECLEAYLEDVIYKLKGI